MVLNQNNSLGLEFKHLTKAVYLICINNNIDTAILSIKEEHFKLYSKFGGGELLRRVESYGNLDQTSLVLSWDPYQISTFFKKAFLNQKR
ncbi:MAG: hypothetical protein U9Q33_06600 [Campylobacterota bacterium]|nr:hypothetical protein [Campylobacterota bacterium]